MSGNTTSGRLPSKTRLVFFYAILAATTAVVAIAVISSGKDDRAQPPIAGGYDLTAPNSCLGAPPKSAGVRLPRTAPAQARVAGPSFDLEQSGRFVDLSNTQGTVSGKLKLAASALPDGSHRLSGDVDCVNESTARLDAAVMSGVKGSIEGRIGAAEFHADLKRDPPDPGAPKPRAPGSIEGLYKLSPRSTCFGSSFELIGGGSPYELEAKDRPLGRVDYDKDTGAVGGSLECARGGEVRLAAQAVDRSLNNLQLTPLDVARPVARAAGEPSETGKVPLTTPSGLPPAGEKVTATKQRESFGHTLAVFFMAVAVVMLAARGAGVLAVKIKQPRVMGEVVAGICLGPTVFGAIWPRLQADLFPTDILPAFGIAANLGLIFYMFLVGLELDPRQLKGRIGQAAAISNASVALPMVLGIAVALPLYELVGPDKKFVAFALFMGVAMSITAFPVLARILVERRMLTRPLGVLTLASAAIDDITAWFLIALATAIAVAGSGGEVLKTIALAVAFCLLMGLLVRPAVSRVSGAYDEAGRVPGGWIAAIFAGVLLSAFVTETIGIAVIFGAFVMGMVMPRHAELTEDVTNRIEDFVITLLLPMFFAYTGLRTNIGLLNRPELWLLTLLLIGVAIVGKFFGAAAAARLTGFGWRPSAVIGTLMNTRGLTELIVLNLALEKGVISEALFAMLVIMALVTTFMAGPLLSLFDPKNEFGEPLEEEMVEARKRTSVEFPALSIPERSIMTAAHSDAALTRLVALGEPLANSDPQRELILVRLVSPPRGVDVRGGLQTEARLMQLASSEVDRVRRELIQRGVAARGVPLLAPDAGPDLSHLAETEDLDLMLIDGQRPILGEGVPRGDVGSILRYVPCDVGVVVAKEDDLVLPRPDAAIVVPFGGAGHDWAALELGAWLASAMNAPLKLLGAAGDTEAVARVTRRLADASLLIQQYAGVSAEPVVIERRRERILEAAAGAGLLVLGLSDRWRREGLGRTRSEIARAAPAPILFVRRGQKPGALAPRDDVTRFAWSTSYSRLG